MNGIIVPASLAHNHDGAVTALSSGRAADRRADPDRAHLPGPPRAAGDLHDRPAPRGHGDGDAAPEPRRPGGVVYERRADVARRGPDAEPRGLRAGRASTAEPGGLRGAQGHPRRRPRRLPQAGCAGRRRAEGRAPDRPDDRGLVGPGAHARGVAGDRVVAGWLVALATALALLGASILPFLSPAYVRFEQDRTGTGSITGYTKAQLDEVTGWLLGDLVLWQGGFDRTLDGAPVLKQPEIDHMLDVRRVFAGFFLLIAAAVVVLAVAFRRARGTQARVATWRAVSNGARGLVVVVLGAGALVLLAFDAAFEVFHQLFFTRGSYTFDPRTDKLVQLFPYDFWSETALAVGVVALAVSIAVWWFARRRSTASAEASA